MAHIAGAGRIDVNERGATPTSLGGVSATAFPFSDHAQRDPVSGVTEGLLDNERARRNQPKIFFTNTGVEYWGQGRSAALIHMSPDGTRDVAPGPNARAYFLAGTQHGPGPFPPGQGLGQQKGNPTDYWWSMRALLVAMDRWVKQGAAPPANRIPLLSDGTLVQAKALAFPAIPGVQSPTSLPPVIRIASEMIRGGAGAGTTLPYLVPQVDADGNERGGILLRGAVPSPPSPVELLAPSIARRTDYPGARLGVPLPRRPPNGKPKGPRRSIPSDTCGGVLSLVTQAAARSSRTLPSSDPSRHPPCGDRWYFLMQPQPQRSALVPS